MMAFFSDPLKLIPFAICVITAVGMWTHQMTVRDVVDLLVAAGIIHTGVSAVNNVNPPK